jgi:hypothetical protein
MATLFVDMDGVCCDFMAPALALHGRSYNEIYPHTTEWDVSKVLGITDDQLWEPIEAAGIEWWENLPELLTKTKTPIVFLTSPGRSEHAPNGKIAWLRRRFGREFRNFIVTPEKHYAAGVGRYLIDDHPINYEDWCKHADMQTLPQPGGVLFPQPWNFRRDMIGRELEHVESELKKAWLLK